MKTGPILAAHCDDPAVNADAYLLILGALLDYFNEHSRRQRANVCFTGAKSTTTLITSATLRIWSSPVSRQCLNAAISGELSPDLGMSKAIGLS